MAGSIRDQDISGVTKVTYLGLFIVFLGAIFYFYEYVLRISPSVMKPELMKVFKITVAGFGSLSAFYLYIYTPLQLIVGILIDMFSIRFILSTAALFCAIGSFLFGLTDSYWVACFSRILQGVGSAFIYIGALKLAATWLPFSRFAFFSCACTAFGFLGAGFGEIILSNTVNSIGWRIPMIVLGVIGIFLAILFLFFLGIKPKTKVARYRKSKKIYKLTLGEALGQLSKIFKNKYLWWAGVLSFFMYLPTTVFAALWGIPYLEKMHHYTPEKAAIACGLIFIGWAIGAPIQGWFSDFFNRRLRLIWISSLISFVLSLIVLYVPGLPYFLVCILFVLFGVASSSQVLTFAMGRDVCELSVVGMVMAFINTLAMIGGMIFQPGLGLLLEAFWQGSYDTAGAKIYSLAAYEKAVLVVPICCLVSFLIGLLVKDKLRLKDFS
jgi:MFS family permease